MQIPFLNYLPMHSAIKAEVLEAFNRVYDSSWFVLAKEVEQFENIYAAINQVKLTFGLSNHLDALHLASKACGIGQG